MQVTNKNAVAVRFLVLLPACLCVNYAESFQIPCSFSDVSKGSHKGKRTMPMWKLSSHENDNISGDEQVRTNDEFTEPIIPQKSQPLFNNPPTSFIGIQQTMRMMGTSPRRVFLSVASSTAIALIANLFGITSHILSQLPEDISEKFGLDYVYPRNGFKRVTARSTSGIGKCSFLIPKDWVADTGLALAQAQRQARTLDMTMNSNTRGGVLPDAAFGPPGRLDSQGLSNGDTNVSVIINNDVKNFNLKESLGEPDVAAEKLILSRFRRPTTLLSAAEVLCGESLQYRFEYIVDRGDKALPLRAISVIAGDNDGNLYITLTVVSTSPEWDRSTVDEKLWRIVNSFKLS